MTEIPRRLATVAIAAVLVVAVGTALASPQTETGTETVPDTTFGTTIDCQSQQVSFMSTGLSEYMTSITTIDISPTSVSTVRHVSMADGNSTVNISQESDVIAVHASPGTLGDNQTIETMTLCNSSDGC